MYCLYAGVAYTYIDVNALAQGIKSFLASHAGFEPLLGLEPMAPIRPQLQASHANQPFGHGNIPMYVCMYVCMYACLSVCMYVHVYFNERTSVYLQHYSLKTDIFREYFTYNDRGTND